MSWSKFKLVIIKWFSVKFSFICCYEHLCIHISQILGIPVPTPTVQKQTDTRSVELGLVLWQIHRKTHGNAGTKANVCTCAVARDLITCLLANQRQPKLAQAIAYVLLPRSLRTTNAPSVLRPAFQNQQYRVKNWSGITLTLTVVKHTVLT